MRKITLLCLTTCIAIQSYAEEGVVTPLTVSSSSSSSVSPDNDRGVSTTVTTPPKPKTRIQGNFKGKDPMIAPDGEIKPKPTDGSRPSGTK